VSKKHAPAKPAGGPQHGGARHAATVGKPAHHKPAHHHKPAPAAPAKGAGHQAGHKHQAPSKKHQPAAASKKHHPKRGFSLGDVACCAAEALAASLRLAGGTVSDDEALTLYWRTARDPDAGASIWETLLAAAEFGLAGVRPVSFGLLGGGRRVSEYPIALPFSATPGIPRQHLILGVNQPAPHTVLATRDGWWSWGELHDPFPGATIDEAWAVTW
jgi:hypothetical protein